MNRRKALPRYDAPEPIMRAAGAWLARRDRGFTAAEQAEFERWIGASPSHGAAVAQLERTMFTFDRLRELAAEGSRPDGNALAPVDRSRRWRPAVLAVAGLAAAFAIMIGSNRPTQGRDVWNFTTSAAGYDRATLADGSVVELNADTILVIEYTAENRRVRLDQGEAHFHVAKDPNRPFVVQAKSVAVSAVGTAFNVKLAEAGVEVLVTAGRVRVEPPPPPSSTASARTGQSLLTADIPLLTAGQKVLVSTTADAEPTTILAVGPEEIGHALAWQSRVSEFRKMPLRAILSEFNRQNRQQIVIVDAELDTLRIGGSFRADQPEAFVRLLEASFGIAAERSGQVINLRKAPAQSP